MCTSPFVSATSLPPFSFDDLHSRGSKRITQYGYVSDKGESLEMVAFLLVSLGTSLKRGNYTSKLSLTHIALQHLCAHAVSLSQSACTASGSSLVNEKAHTVVLISQSILTSDLQGCSKEPGTKGTKPILDPCQSSAFGRICACDLKAGQRLEEAYKWKLEGSTARNSSHLFALVELATPSLDHPTG